MYNNMAFYSLIIFFAFLLYKFIEVRETQLVNLHYIQKIEDHEERIKKLEYGNIKERYKSYGATGFWNIGSERV